MLKILVTGGAGYVGSVCSAQLLQRGHAVTVVVDLSTGHREAVPASADFHRLDIGDKRAVLELFSIKCFDAVFHFSAKVLILESVTNTVIFFAKNLVLG